MRLTTPPPSVTTYRDRLQILAAVATRIDQVIEAGDWKKAEELLEERDQLMNDAFPQQIPVELRGLVQQVFQQLVHQNKCIQSLGEKFRYEAEAEFNKLQRNQSSLQAYKLDDDV